MQRDLCRRRASQRDIRLIAHVEEDWCTIAFPVLVTEEVALLELGLVLRRCSLPACINKGVGGRSHRYNIQRS